jgi:hypothetical protein
VTRDARTAVTFEDYESAGAINPETEEEFFAA